MALTYDELIEIQENRKKKKKTNNDVAPTRDYIKTEKSLPSLAPITPNSVLFAPIPTVTTAQVPKATESELLVPETKKRKWFEAPGYFDDGWDMFDVSKTILSSANDLGDQLQTGILGMGEKAVDAVAWLGTKAVTGTMGLIKAGQTALNNVTGNEEDNERVKERYESAKNRLEDKTSKFIAKDLYDEEAVAKKLLLSPTDLLKYVPEVDGEEGSVFGDKADSLAQSGGQLAAQLALTYANVPWFVTSGVTSFGGEAEAALNEGATFDQAGGSALVSAGAEILTEKLSGGIKFGGKTLDDVLLKPFTERISNDILKRLVNFGIDATGEGFEEFVSGIFSNLGSALYKEEDLSEILWSKEAWDEYLEGFLGGMFLGGASNIVTGGADGNDTDLTDIEQKVVDKVVEDRIAEATEDGKTITKAEEKKIRETLRRVLDRGGIDTETVESILGGEDFETYKRLNDARTKYEQSINDEIKALQDEHKKLQEEYEELNKIKLTEAELGHRNRQTEIKDRQKEINAKIGEVKAELKELEADTSVSDLKAKLSQNVYEMVKGSRLEESYREADRHKQVFTADTNQYESEYAKKTIQNAIDFSYIVDGKEYKLDNSNETHDLIDLAVKYATERKIEIAFTTTEGLAEMKKNGNEYSIDEDPNEINAFISEGHRKIFLNMDTNESLQAILGHEVGHNALDTKSIKKLNNVIKSYLGEAEYKKIYDKKAKLYKPSDIEEEIVVDFCGERFLTDYDFVMNLAVNNRNIFQKAWDSIKYLHKLATAGSKEARQLEKAKRIFEKAYRESANNTDAKGTKKSLSEGVELTAEQETYFKDSKVRDENGNLKVMYHGTSKGGFTSFDTYGSQYGLFGTGSYFTDNKSIAESYTNKGKGNNKQVYETYLNITNPLDMDAQADVSAWSKAFPDADFTNCTTNEDCYRAMEEYFEDEQYSKWEASEIAVDAIRGMGYDGITHIGGGRVNADGERHQVYIAFEPEQIKNIDNVAPTKDADIRYSLTEDGNLKNDLLSRSARTFGITKTGDYVQVQRQIFSTLEKESFFNDEGKRSRTVTNRDSSMQVEINKKGIKETFNFDNYGKFSREYRGLKLATVRMLPQIIENGKLTSDNVDNYHNEKSYVKFAYIESDIQVDGQSVTVKIDIKKSPQKNKFWVHSVDIKEKVDGIPVNDSTSLKRGNSPINSAKSISYTEDNVNRDEIAPIKEASSEDGVFFDAQNSKYSLSEDSVGRELSKGKRDFFKNSKIKDADGNLKVMYHGSHETFTVFDKKKARSSGTYGKGFYFTDSKSHAGTYGDSYEVYLNITNPLQNGTNDITKDQLRKFVEAIAEDEDYGIENYGYGATIDSVTDSVYGKSDFGMLLDLNVSCIGNMVEAVELFNKVNGTDYDGIVAPTETVAFYPNQIKSVDNENPTDNPDIRFSLSENVEETKNLMALHNLHSNELVKQLKMGGIAYPSVAVTKPGTLSHEGFGDITLILNKDAIDPKKSKYNKLYSADAYTPTFPNVNYEASRDVANNIANKVKSLYDAIPEDYKRSLTAFRDYTNIDERLNSARGEEGLIERYLDDYSFKQLYLADKGEVVPTEIKRTETQITEYQREQYQFVVDRLGEELLESSKPMDSYTPPLTARLQWFEQYGDDLKDAYAEYWADDGTMTKEEALEIANSESAGYWARQIKAITDYIKTGGITVKEEADIPSTNALIDEKTNVAEYKEWLANLFSGIEGSSGIRNSKDLFTPSGKRRSFSQLHDPVTIDNVIKVMRKQGQTGQGAFGTGNIRGASAQEFGSIAEMKANSDRLGEMDEAEHEEITQQINDRIFEIAKRYSNGKDLMDAQTTIVEAVSKYETKEGIARYLKQFDYVYKYTDSIGDDIIELRDYIRSIPTPYFEAKPQRAVGLDEVAAFVIPYDADVKLKQELLNKGYSIAEYDPKIEGDRQRVVNSFEQYKFSLSDANETPKEYGNFNTYAKDILVARDIAPMQETVSKTEQVQGTVNEDDYAPMTEEQANAMYEAEKGYINSFTDADMPSEIDAPIYSADTISIADKALKNISAIGRDILFLNPKERRVLEDVVQKYSTSETQNELDLFDNIKELFGEKSYTERIEEVYEIKQALRGYRINVSPFIKRDIADYTQFMRRNFGKISFSKEGMPVDTAYMELSASYPNFFPSDIVNPTDQLLQIAEVANMEKDETLTAELDDELILEATEVIEEAVSSYKEKQMLKATEKAGKAILRDELKRDKEAEKAKIKAEKEAQRERENVISAPLKGATEVVNRKANTFRTFVRNFVSKGSVFETLALKTGNRAVEDKYKMWKDYSESMAQYFMENGKDKVKSLKSIVEKANKSGLYNDFDRYLKHKHNVDRMQYDLPVFGYETTAEMSQQIADELEAQHPEFKEWANETYAINDRLRQMMVDAGIITQETADLWAKKYPHYVPIERLSDDDINHKGKGIGISAPIKRATGGSSETESILKAMAHRTEQVFKAVNKNAFGIELKNTIGPISQITGMNTDDILDGLTAMDEGLLQVAKDGNAPTFTVFENGKRVTFDISNEMYEALKPTSEAMSKEHKILSKPTAWHKKVLTEYNLFFTARNFPKDAQEVILNSHHAAKTYANMPNAVAELLRGKGKYVTEYWENGGKSNTYFDGRKNEFENDSTFKKVVGFIPSGISKVNDFVEAIPRLAEYMASRKQGATIEAAMVDAARVTTDFSDGGDITKFFNRNGVTFLNASVQGVSQQARNIRQAKAEGFKGVAKLAGKYALAGLPVLLFNHLMWDDDEDYEELSEYVKDNYYIVAKYGDGQFVRIPKGRTISVIQEFFEQFGNMITGEETDWKNVATMFTSNVAPNNPIDSNILAPIIQAHKGKTWYGEDLVPSRLQKEPLPEQYDESIDTISKWLGEKFGGSPYKINYVLNQYSGFIGDIVLPNFTPEAENGDNSFAGSFIAPLRDQFVVDRVIDNKNPSEFFSLGDELEVNANADNATDEDKLKYKYINAVNSEISDLYKQKREIQNSNLSDELKFKQVRDIQAQINELSKDALNTYENVKIDGSYATVGGRHFRLNDEGEWQKITDEQLEKQNDAIGILGITAGQYWSNKDEYDMMAFEPEIYEVLQKEGISVEDYKENHEKWLHFRNDDFSWAANNPEKYTIAKAITDDVVKYREITSGLYEIRADKDANGKTINGSAKAKKKEYIWGLDIDDGAKYILFKNEYNADDTYNEEIVDYLNSRDDISYDEMNTILEEIGFTVDRETGYIYW